MRSGILILAGLGVLALGTPACNDDGDGASSTTAPSSEATEDVAERLSGTWDVSVFDSYHTWEPDGTWYVAAATGGDPYDFGTYSVDGSIVTLNTDADSPECPGTTGIWEVTFIDADTISWEVIDDDCASRGRNVPQAQWDRVETE